MIDLLTSMWPEVWKDREADNILEDMVAIFSMDNLGWNVRVIVPQTPLPPEFQRKVFNAAVELFQKRNTPDAPILQLDGLILFATQMSYVGTSLSIAPHICGNCSTPITVMFEKPDSEVFLVMAVSN